MQAYTKKIIISFLALFLGISIVACNGDKTTDTSETPNDSVIPSLSNPDSVFIESDGYSITYNDLYDQVKINDGLNQLLFMVDSDLLSTYVAAVTTEEIEARTDKLIYGSSDPEDIAKLTEDEKADLEESFYDSMYLLGYEGRTADYVRLVVARENFAIAQMVSEDNSEEPWYAGPTAVAEYYAAKYQYDIHTIKVRFMSESDAKSVLRLFNLVSKEGELLLYTGTIPLDQVPSTSLDETNTRSLSDTEILQQFIIIYNYIYGDFKDEIDENATYEDLMLLEDLIVSYDTLSEANASLDNFVYDTLGTYDDYMNDVDDKLYYTYEPVKYYSSSDTSYYMILNLQLTEKADVEDFDGDEAALVALIGQDIYDEMKQEIIDSNLSASSFVSNRIVTLRQEHGFNIYDYYLGVDYANVDGDFEIDAEGHATDVASYDDKVITADQLLAFALNNNAPLYTIYASQTKAVVAAHFEDVYCANKEEECVYNVLQNTSEKMTEHWDEQEYLKQQFDASYYASYYEFEEYLYLAYGVKNDYDMMYNYYVKATLQPFLIYDEIMKDNYAILNEILSLSQPYFDNYFSLDVRHILIYFDRDENGSPDDYDEFYAELEDTTTYDQLLADFEVAIREYLADEENSLADFVNLYKKAKRDDADWGTYKRYGFHVLTETLGDLNYKGSIGVYEDSFVEALIALYQVYVTPDYENEDYLDYTELVPTSYGVHLIRAEQGDDFEKPSAKFSMTYDDETGEAEYLDGMVNASNQISFEQLKIYADYEFTVITYGDANLEVIYDLVRPDIPDSVMDAIEFYVEDLYNALYVVGYMNHIIIDQLASGTYTHAVSSYCDMTSTEFMNTIDNIAVIYMKQIFADYDHR